LVTITDPETARHTPPRPPWFLGIHPPRLSGIVQVTEVQSATYVFGMREEIENQGLLQAFGHLLP